MKMKQNQAFFQTFQNILIPDAAVANRNLNQFNF